MPRYLGINWDAHGLRVVAGQVKGGKVTVEQTVAFNEPLTLVPEAALAAGKRLKEQLKSAGISAAPALLCLGRERAVFRDVRFPDVPAHETPDVVRFQTIKELTSPVEEVVIDYQPVSLNWPTGERRALAVVVRREVLTAVKKLCTGAGLKLEGVSVRAFGLAAQHRLGAGAKLGTQEVAASLVLANGTGELCVSRGDELLFSRTLAVNGAGPAGLAPEVKRSLAAFAGLFPGHDVQRVFVTGLSNGTDGEALSHGVRLPVFPQALPVPDGSTAFAGALGILQERARGKLAVNLLAPKQPPPPSNAKKRYVLASIAALALLAIGLAIFFSVLNSGRKSDILTLTQRRNELDKQIKSYADMEKRLDAINDWSAGELVVLDDLYDVIAKFPDQPGVRITKATWSAIAVPVQAAAASKTKNAPALKPSTAPSAKPIAQLVLEAFSENSEAFDRLKRALEADVRHWKLTTWEKDTPGSNQIRCTLQVYRQLPEEYTAVLMPTENKNAPTTEGGGRRPGGENRFRFGAGGGGRP